MYTYHYLFTLFLEFFVENSSPQTSHTLVRFVFFLLIGLMWLLDSICGEDLDSICGPQSRWLLDNFVIGFVPFVLWH